jgi:predicted acylesterase/phospholipase RssA
MFENGQGHHVVDGGVLSNFPLKYLIDARHAVASGVLGSSFDGQPAGVLGILLDESKAARKAAPAPAHAKAEKGLGQQVQENLLIMSNLSRLLSTMTGAWDLEAIEDHGAEPLICRIPAGGYDTLDFEMNDQAMAQLVESGRGAMKRYLG